MDCLIPLEFYTSMYVGSVDVHCSEGVVPRASDSFLSLLQWTSTVVRVLCQGHQTVFSHCYSGRPLHLLVAQG